MEQDFCDNETTTETGDTRLMTSKFIYTEQNGDNVPFLMMRA